MGAFFFGPRKGPFFLDPPVYVEGGCPIVKSPPPPLNRSDILRLLLDRSFFLGLAACVS